MSFLLPNIQLSDDYWIHLSISHASIPVSFYNVNRTNNSLWYSLGAGEPLQIQIPWGQYSVNTLRSTLMALWTGMSLTYQPIQNRFSFSHASQEFTLLQGSSCFPLLGLSQQDHVSSGRTVTGDLCVNLSPTRMILVEVNKTTGNINKTSPNAQNILCCIPVTAGFGSVINFMPAVRFSSNLQTSILESIDLRLTDQDGLELDLNGVHWSMALQVDCVRYTLPEL